MLVYNNQCSEVPFGKENNHCEAKWTFTAARYRLMAAAVLSDK